MKSKPTARPFVSLRIGAPESPKFREIRLSRFQFELLLIVVPTLIIWGIISTTILVANKRALYPKFAANTDNQPIQSQEIASAPLNHAAATHTATQSVDRKSTTETTHQPPPLGVTAAKIESAADNIGNHEGQNSVNGKPNKWGQAFIKINGYYAVNVSIRGISDRGPFTLKMATKNLSGTHQNGYFWANVRAVTKAGDDVWYTINQNMAIDGDGRSENPEKGIHFSFRHTRDQTLQLIGPSADISRFAEIVIGFADENSKQVIVKAEL